jgi:hypothetical protein
MLPTKFQFIWPSSFRGVDLKKSANQKQELPVSWRPILVVEEVGEPPTMGKQLVKFITCGCESSAPF